MPASTIDVRPVNDTDLLLIDRHRHGDPDAFEELYDEFSDMVFSVALRLSGDPDDAADLSQETFLKIHRHLGGFGGRSSLKTWIYQVALNCCRTRLRQQSSKKRLASRSVETLEQLPATDRTPEENAIAWSEGEKVMAALQRIPNPYREAVVLRDLEGLSYQEIAQVLRTRLGTVRSRLARGREHLRQILEESFK